MSKELDIPKIDALDLTKPYLKPEEVAAQNAADTIASIATSNIQAIERLLQEAEEVLGKDEKGVVSAKRVEMLLLFTLNYLQKARDVAWGIPKGYEEKIDNLHLADVKRLRRMLGLGEALR